MRRTGSLFLFLFLFAAAARAHELPSGELAALGRIWGVVNYAHPWMGYRDADLDAATLRAVARVRGGATAGVAVDELLRTLGDDASHVTRVCYDDALPTIDRSTRMLADGVVYLHATSANAASALRSAKAAIVDLRPQPGRCSAPALAGGLEPLLVRGTIRYPRHRKVRHYGYRSQGETSADFDSGFRIIDAGKITGEATTLARVVFIVDARSAIPPVAAALASAGQAVFVSVGDFPLHTAVDHCQMALGDGSIVTLRTSELIDKDGYADEPAPMMSLAANTTESEVIAAALQLSKPRGSRRRASSGTTAAPLGDYEWRADARFATTELPSIEERVFAAFRIWNVLEFFHGSGMWEGSINDMFARIEHVTTRADYELALAEIVREHGTVDAPAVRAFIGVAAPPFELMPIEGKPVDVKTGDELLRIDGRDVKLRLQELQQYTSAYESIRDLANGAMNSTSAFTFRRPDGSQYDVTQTRATRTVTPNAARILDGNIAYVDLRSFDDFDFNAYAATRAMIVDLRGERLNTKILDRLATSSTGPVSRIPVLLGGASNYADVSHAFAMDAQPKYAGRVVALIDERTDMRIALAFRELAHAIVVGTTTDTTHGDASQLVVPGNILVRFTASELKATDPDYVVARTIQGLGLGRDEQLDAALAILAN